MRFQKYAFSFSWKTYRSIRFHTTVSMRFQLSAQKLSKTWRKLHPRRPRGSQSGQEKRRDESLKLRAPGYRLSPNYFLKFKLMPAPDWAQKILCIIVPNRRTHLLSSFRVFVHDGYCLDHGLPGSCTKEMHALRKLSVCYKIPIWFQNTVCPKTKDAFPKIQA